MLIEGPFEIGIVDQEDSSNRELHVSFTREFSGMALEERYENMVRYISSLQEVVNNPETSAAEVQGMQMIMQIAEQLLPHIQSDEIPLNETIVVEIQNQSTLGGLIQESKIH
jgi:hypothetical protein